LLLPMNMAILTGVRWKRRFLSFYRQGSWTLLHVFTGRKLYLFLWKFLI
jgi:hypothetical protein